MSIRRVQSKSEPKYKSYVSDEWLERFPDDFDVIDDDLDPVAAASRRPDTESLPRLTSDPSDYR